VRIAAQRRPSPTSASVQGDALGQLAVCLEGLKDNAATNPGVRKMRSTIQTLMQRLGVPDPSDVLGAGQGAAQGGGQGQAGGVGNVSNGSGERTGDVGEGEQTIGMGVGVDEMGAGLDIEEIIR
jgi:hypothetical protein